MILDVRKGFEVAAGAIPGGKNIPLDELRDRLGELPRDKELLVYCQVGLRGYLACRILSQNGFKCRNLTGGIKTYAAATANAPRAVEPAKTEVCDDLGVSCSARQANHNAVQIVKTIDATGLQCPGPIMRLANELDTMNNGEAVSIVTTDPGFVSDIGAWCHSTGNRLIDAGPENGCYKAIIAKSSGELRVEPSNSTGKGKTIVVFSSDFDRVVASFIVANGAAAMGSEVTMFFTFWGINALRRSKPVAVNKSLVERMFGWLMPRGADKLSLSRMNMGGMGLAMIKGIMKRKNVPSLPELIASAQKAGVRLVVCTMSMDLMGIKREELIDGVEEGGVAMYLDRAEAGNVNLFI